MTGARGLSALAALLSLSSPLAALEVEGRYKGTPEADCAAGDDAEGLIRIEDGVFHGIGAQCEMRNPVNVVGMDAQLFDMHCGGATGGDGEEWTERALFMEGAEGGLILAWNGYAFRYPRCPAEAETPEGEVAADALATTGAEDGSEPVNP